MPSITVPDYAGGSLVNLVSELEARLVGSAPEPRLSNALGATIPDAASYVLVLFDGLGTAQLEHSAAERLKTDLVGSLDAPFPTTTTVSLATVATGLPPTRHGLLGYQLWVPELDRVVNTIKWTTLWGDPVAYDTATLLPAPNLWERLDRGGIEPITVQPGNFADTPLSTALYRGSRHESVFSVDEIAVATADLAATPGRFVFTYLPHVDFAAHVFGQQSTQYAEAVGVVSAVWDRIVTCLPNHAVAVGTADHGHVDFPRERQARIAKASHEGRSFYGDGRAMFVRGDGAGLADDLPATWVPLREMAHWWGPGTPHPSFSGRAPDGVLVADDDRLLLHRFTDDRMIGNHGALTDGERRVPLLVGEAGPRTGADHRSWRM